MAEIKWIKITTDIFDDEKIQIIEKMPEGDTMLVIWLKLLTIAGKKNECGMVYMTQNIPYTVEMLSDIFHRDSRIISLAINTFISFEMIAIENDIIKVLNWEKHQNIAGMEKIREQTKLRVTKYRERKKIEKCNVTVTKSNAPRIELDKNRIDKNKIKKRKYGEYKKVLLSDDEYEKLKTEWGESELLRMVKIMDEGIEMKGYRYKSHLLALKNWKERESPKKLTLEELVAKAREKRSPA